MKANKISPATSNASKNSMDAEENNLAYNGGGGNDSSSFATMSSKSLSSHNQMEINRLLLDLVKAYINDEIIPQSLKKLGKHLLRKKNIR